MIIVIFIVTLIAYLAIGTIASKRAAGLDDYFVAGRNAGQLLVLGTFAASWVSATGIVGYTGASYKNGPGTVIMWGAVPGFMLAVLFIVSKLYRTESWTMFDYFEKRYCDKRLALIAVFAMFFGMFPYLLSQVMGSANILAGITGIDYKIMVLVACVVFTILTLTGGATSVTVTDTTMLIIIIFVSIFCFPFAIKGFGGWDAIMTAQITEAPERFHWTGAALTPISAISTNLVWMCGMFAGPHQGSRILIAKDERTAMGGVILATTFGVIIIWSLHNMTAGLWTQVKDLPQDQATVYLFTHMKPAVPGAIGISALFAAALSTATTMLLTLATGVGKDVYKRLNPDAPNEKMLKITKVAVVAFAVVTFLFAFFSVSAVSQWGEAGSSMFGCAYFAPLIFGLNWKKANRQGAYASMIGGGGLFLILWIGQKFFGMGALPFGLTPVLLGLIVSIVLMLVVSAATKSTPEQDAFWESIQVPKKGAFHESTNMKFKLACCFAVAIGVIMIICAFTIIPSYPV